MRHYSTKAMIERCCGLLGTPDVTDWETGFIEITLTPPAAQPDLVDKARAPKKKTAAEKIGTDADPFANTDIPPLETEQSE